MTIKKIIYDFEKQRPGSCLSLPEYLEHINRLEQDIYDNIISRHEGAPSFVQYKGEEESLLVCDMYAQIYLYYLLAQTDLENGDITRYSNDMALFNNLLSEYGNWYNRTYMPNKRAKLGGY